MSSRTLGTMMLKKIFLTFIALCLILFGSLILMMGYIFNNPEKVFTAFNSMTERFMEAQAYEENEEFFIQGLSTLDIRSREVDVDVHIYNGSTLKIALHGKVPRFDSGGYMTLKNQDAQSITVELHHPAASQWVQMSINGQEYTKESDAELKADIYVPASFKKNLLIDTGRGNVSVVLPRDAFYELDLSSVSGQIHNNQQDPIMNIDPKNVGKIKISTDKGRITIERL